VRHNAIALALIVLLAGTVACELPGVAPTATEQASPSPTAIPPQAARAPQQTHAQAEPQSGPRSRGGELLPTTSPPAQQPDPTDAPVVRVVEQVRPAVVSIQTRAIGFDFFLQPVPQQGAGSGVLFDPRGYIITNSHVIEGAQEITVGLPSGRKLPAKVVGADPPTDLAVLQVQGDGLPVAALGNSDTLRVGETVIAIGNALNLPGGPTVTRGIVGALGRTLTGGPGEAVYYDLIQTDAAINPGNSGGPLVNLRGEVIGINTVIIQAPGAGIGFAIAINLAKPIIDQLITRGHVVRPLLGVAVQEITPEAVRACRLGRGSEVPEGLVVARVDNPAAQAGIAVCDVIVALDSHATRTQADLLKHLWARKPGDTVTVTIVRGGQRMQINVRLTERTSARSELVLA
jgi:S1-C subfamily serine protease